MGKKMIQWTSNKLRKNREGRNPSHTTLSGLVGFFAIHSVSWKGKTEQEMNDLVVFISSL